MQSLCYIIKKAKKEAWRNYISELNNKTAINKAWEISGEKLQTTITYLNTPNRGKTTDKKEIANQIADEFSQNSSSNRCSTKFQKYKNIANKKKIQFHIKQQGKLQLLFLYHRTEKNSINKEMPYQFLKNLPETSLTILVQIFYDIWWSNNFPKHWLEAIIIPITKPRKDHSNPTNYHSIALISCVCKTMERMVNARLIWYLEKQHILFRYQSGFRQNQSDNDQLIRFETYICNGLIKNRHVVSIFFDLEKAYDTTWRYGIVKDLHKTGIKGNMAAFIKNFLSHRNFTVRHENASSDMHKQETGVPQGSILSVTLFILKINSITESISTGIEKFL